MTCFMKLCQNYKNHHWGLLHAPFSNPSRVAKEKLVNYFTKGCSGNISDHKS